MSKSSFGSKIADLQIFLQGNRSGDHFPINCPQGGGLKQTLVKLLQFLENLFLSSRIVGIQTLFVLDATDFRRSTHTVVEQPGNVTVDIINFRSKLFQF